MKEYPRHMQERPFWCVPACLQSVLESKEIYLPQTEIADKLNIDETGFDFSLGRLRDFLRDYNLLAGFENPFLGVYDTHLLLENSFPQLDVLVAYDFGKLVGEVGIKHASLVVGYNKDKISLQDPCHDNLLNLDVKDLVGAIQVREDERYGFYVIG